MKRFSLSRGVRMYVGIVSIPRTLDPSRQAPPLPSLPSANGTSPCGPFGRSEIRARLNPNPYVNRTPDSANRIPYFVRSVYTCIIRIVSLLHLPTYRFRPLLKPEDVSSSRESAREFPEEREAFLAFCIKWPLFAGTS